MNGRIAALVRGREVITAVGVAAVLGLALMIVPVLDRVLLLVAAACFLITAGLVGGRVLRRHPEIEWTTSAGTPARVRGSDRRITALARAVDASLNGDATASDTVRTTLRSLADARLGARGLTLDATTAEVEEVLGRDLTAYLSAVHPPKTTANELRSFIITLEEH